MKVCCGIIITYNLQLQFTSSNFNDENLKAKKLMVVKEKGETLTLENETRRWIMMAKFPRFDSSSGATLVMERNVLENLTAKE
jgi:hypothetical protein